MIKRHLKLFLVLVVASVVINFIGLLVYILSTKLLTLYILSSALFIGLLIFNYTYSNQLSKKALRKKITKEQYYFLRETRSIIWLGVYIHVGVFFVCLLLSRIF